MTLFKKRLKVFISKIKQILFFLSSNEKSCCTVQRLEQVFVVVRVHSLGCLNLQCLVFALEKND
jgi:hypothetical protein